MNLYIKLTVEELKLISQQAEYNYKHGGASCIVLIDENGKITQPSGYQECFPYTFPLIATVCEI